MSGSFSNFGLHVVLFPAGRWGYVGNVPADLAYELLTDNPHILKQVAQFGPGLLLKSGQIRLRTFEGEQAAIDYATERGHTVVPRATKVAP